jgi:hypothetical protein
VLEQGHQDVDAGIRTQAPSGRAITADRGRAVRSASAPSRDIPRSIGAGRGIQALCRTQVQHLSIDITRHVREDRHRTLVGDR